MGGREGGGRGKEFPCNLSVNLNNYKLQGKLFLWRVWEFLQFIPATNWRRTQGTDMTNKRKQLSHTPPGSGFLESHSLNSKSLGLFSGVASLWLYPCFKALHSPCKGQERLDPPREIWAEFEGWVRGHLAELERQRQPGKQRGMDSTQLQTALGAERGVWRHKGVLRLGKGEGLTSPELGHSRWAGKLRQRQAHAPFTDDRRSQHFCLYFIDFFSSQGKIWVTINRT